MMYRIPRFGNPRFYWTFIDEGLNVVLRALAMKAHRSRWEERVFRLFHLISPVIGACFLPTDTLAWKLI